MEVFRTRKRYLMCFCQLRVIEYLIYLIATKEGLLVVIGHRRHVTAVRIIFILIHLLFTMMAIIVFIKLPSVVFRNNIIGKALIPVDGYSQDNYLLVMFILMILGLGHMAVRSDSSRGNSSIPA